MSRTLFLTLAVLGAAGTSAASAADYATTVQSLDPIAYFRLDTPGEPSTVGGYGTTDTNVGTTPPGAGAPIADLANAAAIFYGDNTDRSEINTGLSGGIDGAGSINAWVNLAATPGALGHIEYVAGESAGGNDFDVQFDGSDTLSFYTAGGGAVSTDYTHYGLDSWHMLTATYDGDVSRNLYIDGTLVATQALSGNTAAKTNPFTIGYSDVFTGRTFAGAIDEVAVFGTSLTADQVATIYASRDQAPGGGTTPAVPEPASWAMLLAGFGLVGGAARRRQAAHSVQAV